MAGGRYIVAPHFRRWAVYDVLDDTRKSTWDTRVQAEKDCARRNERQDRKAAPRGEVA